MRCRRGQGQGLDLGWVGDLGWGGVGLGSWGWAFSFLCFGIVECAHGHAYAKQVRMMCVLSVPLLDQVWGGNRCEMDPEAVNSGDLGPILESKNTLNTIVLTTFTKNARNDFPWEHKKLMFLRFLS